MKYFKQQTIHNNLIERRTNEVMEGSFAYTIANGFLDWLISKFKPDDRTEILSEIKTINSSGESTMLMVNETDSPSPSVIRNCLNDNDWVMCNYFITNVDDLYIAVICNANNDILLEVRIIKQIHTKEKKVFSFVCTDEEKQEYVIYNILSGVLYDSELITRIAGKKFLEIKNSVIIDDDDTISGCANESLNYI